MNHFNTEQKKKEQYSLLNNSQLNIGDKMFNFDLNCILFIDNEIMFLWQRQVWKAENGLQVCSDSLTQSMVPK